MQVELTYQGYAPRDHLHQYLGRAENGVVREFHEEVFIPNKTVMDLPDEQWMPDSGWAVIACDLCGRIRWELVRRGSTVACAMCGQQETIPQDAVLRSWKSADCEEYV